MPNQVSGGQIGETPGNSGLGEKSRKDWPDLTPAEAKVAPIDRLGPGTRMQEDLLSYLNKRLDTSERAMSAFYDRWRYSERRIQAYIELPNFEQMLKEENDSSKPSQVVSVTVPYMFATLSTIVTYLIHTFAGRKPMFQVGTNKKESVEAARLMELVLQYNADHTRLIKYLFQYFMDGELYGLGVLRTAWKNTTGIRTVWKERAAFGPLGRLTGSQKVRVREKRTIYEGNEVMSIDPFLFFPDPRVPMVEVNRKGEYVFIRTFEGKHILLREQSAGQLKWVNHAGGLPRNSFGSESSPSDRHIRSDGDPHPGSTAAITTGKDSIQVDQCTINLIPREHGLSESEEVEMWIFTILNRKQIAQAQKLDADHDMHPVAVIEPYTLGYGFGHLGMADYLGPVQDTISWYINSRIYNVRASLNNMFVVDPSMVEMQDVTRPKAGKVIRLKRAAYGRDVKTAIQQFPVADVTGGHINDLQLFMRIGDALSAVSDNLRGQQAPGGRRTATEVRTNAEAAASRLASHARLISAQGIVDLAEQMAVNIQQNLEKEFYLQIVGEQGLETDLQISPEHVTGDFYYPVNDGTLPLDKIALLDTWKEIMIVVQGDQELRSKFSLPKIFEWVAELGGAKNIEAFKVNVQSPEAIAAQAANGQLTPLNGGLVNGGPAQPGTQPATPAVGGVQ